MNDESIMIDDTKSLLHDDKTRPATFLENAAEILKHPITRARSMAWATSVRFLTFDNGENVEPSLDGTASDKNEGKGVHWGCQVCRAHIDGRRKDENREYEPPGREKPCEHNLVGSCDKCWHIPLFPNSGEVTTFRVRQVRSAKPDNPYAFCGHFVAVSYRWTKEKEEQSMYKVIEEDGSTRDMRAPKSVIDRAVAFARQNGFRRIWIDQVSFTSQAYLCQSNLYFDDNDVAKYRNAFGKTRSKS